MRLGQLDEKYSLYLFMQNIVVKGVEGGRIQALIGKFSARVVTQEDVIFSLGTRLSAKFSLNLRYYVPTGGSTTEKSDIVVSNSVDRAHK